MFDVGFWELSLILIVALLVVGPERLPRLARTAGMWMGKMRHFVRSVQVDIKKELAAEDLKRTLAEQARSTGLHDIIEETGQIAADTEQYLNDPLESEPRSDSETPPSRGKTTEPPHDADR